MATIQEIKSKGTLLQLSSSRSGKIVVGGRTYPKFSFYTYEGEEYAVPSDMYSEFINKQKTKNTTIQVDFDLEDYIGEDPDKNVAKLKIFAEKFKEKFFQHNLYIWSNGNATQKTTMAKALAKRINELYPDAVCEFVLANSLVTALKDNDFSDDKKSIVEQCTYADLLIIDDAFAADKVTQYRSGYQTAFLDTFLRERLEVNRKATVFTSNLSVDEIGGFWGSSIQSLIERSVYCMNFSEPIGDKIIFSASKIFDGEL